MGQSRTFRQKWADKIGHIETVGDIYTKADNRTKVDLLWGEKKLSNQTNQTIILLPSPSLPPLSPLSFSLSVTEVEINTPSQRKRTCRLYTMGPLRG